MTTVTNMQYMDASGGHRTAFHHILKSNETEEVDIG
jgi:hypothetical protein